MKRLMVWEPALAANDKHTLISSVAESLAQQGVVSFGEQDALVEALVARKIWAIRLLPPTQRFRTPHARRLLKARSSTSNSPNRFSIGVKAQQWIGSCSPWCPNSRARTMGKP